MKRGACASVGCHTRRANGEDLERVAFANGRRASEEYVENAYSTCLGGRELISGSQWHAT